MEAAFPLKRKNAVASETWGMVFAQIWPFNLFISRILTHKQKGGVRKVAYEYCIIDGRWVVGKNILSERLSHFILKNESNLYQSQNMSNSGKKT